MNIDSWDKNINTVSDTNETHKSATMQCLLWCSPEGSYHSMLNIESITSDEVQEASSEVPCACEVCVTYVTERDTFKAFQSYLMSAFKKLLPYSFTPKAKTIESLIYNTCWLKVQTMLLATSSVEFLSNLKSSWDNTKL